LAKCDSWEELPLNLKVIFQKIKEKGKNPTQSFAACKRERKDHKGVGVEVIHAFLGKNWKQWRIQQALEDIREEVIIQAL